MAVTPLLLVLGMNTPKFLGIGQVPQVLPLHQDRARAGSLSPNLIPDITP